jgi:cell division protein FtsB
MTKRFKLVEYLPNVIRIKDNNQKLNSYEIVDLLNELHEENQQLKKEIENLKQGLIHAAFDKEWK